MSATYGSRKIRSPLNYRLQRYGGEAVALGVQGHPIGQVAVGDVAKAFLSRLGVPHQDAAPPGREQRLEAYRAIRDQLLAHISERFTAKRPGNE